MPGATLLHLLLYVLHVQDVRTQTTSAERAALSHHARNRRKAVELGVFEAVNTVLIASALAPGGTLFAVDLFPRGRIGICWAEIMCRIHVRRHSVEEKVRFVRALSWEATDKVAGDVDFLFIDADHSYDALRKDWVAWSHRIAKGGIVALHDTAVADSFPVYGSLGFFDEAIRNDSRFRLVETVDSMNILQRW